MEFIKKYRFRSYIFHSERDANFADKLWLQSYNSLMKFDDLLEEYKIEFEYEINF